MKVNSLNPVDLELVRSMKNEPAPLLPILHAIHDRDGNLGELPLRAVAEELRIPIAELYGLVTFYHHFAQPPATRSAARICTGPICVLKGAKKILKALEGEGPTSMACSGRCDIPVPVLRGNSTQCGLEVSALKPVPSPLPAPNPDETQECVFRNIREADQNTLQGYESRGGYEALALARSKGANWVLEQVAQSGLAGRGGAGFPTGRKWTAVRDAQGFPKTIVCNADEGEPGCFKDRALLDHDPHAVIEGMAAAAVATGAVRGFIYLRYEYPETYTLLQRALSEARASGHIGDGFHSDGQPFHLYLRRGAGAYICGEETSLLNSLEGKHPFPRNRPPYPVTHGFEDLPTVVNNVETLASVPPILTEGAEWYRGLGCGDHAGTKLISLSGDIQKPGNYEVPLGLPLKTLLHEWAGGPAHGHEIQAVTMAGLSGGFLAAHELDVTLDEPSIRSRGSFLGAGGIMVLDDRRDIVDFARSAMDFFAHESCGKCFPCRIGTQRLMERLGDHVPPAAIPDWRSEVRDLGDVMRATSACGLGQAAPLITESLMRAFPKDVDRHLTSLEGQQRHT